MGFKHPSKGEDHSRSLFPPASPLVRPRRTAARAERLRGAAVMLLRERLRYAPVLADDAERLTGNDALPDHPGADLTSLPPTLVRAGRGPVDLFGLE